MERGGLVTVVVLSYNRREYLRETLESALAQTYQNFHVLIVDDASPDGAGDVAREYASRYPGRVTAICKERQAGAVDSLNRIVFPRCRESDYVAFLPHDDLWAPEKLERQIECFAADPELGLAFTEANIIDAEGRATGQTFSDMYGTWDGGNVTRRLFLGANFICGASVVVSREALGSFGFHVPPPIRFLDDYFMWTVISSQYRLQSLEEPLTFYRVTPDNVSSRYTLALYREEYEVRHLLYERFPTVRQVVSGEEGRDFLRRCALDSAKQNLSAGRLWQFAWFGARALQAQPSLRTVAALGAMAREREQGLLAEVAEKDRAIQWLSEKVSEKDRAIGWLSDQVREKDQAIQWLSEQVTEKDRAVQWLSEQITEKERAIHALSKPTANLEQMSRPDVPRVTETEEEMQRLRDQVAAWERRWSLLQDTILWRLLTKIRAVRKVLAPSDTRRGRLWFRLLRRDSHLGGELEPGDALE